VAGKGDVFVNTINYISQGVQENISEGKRLNYSKRPLIRAEEDCVFITVKKLDQILLHHVSFLVTKELLRSPYECISIYHDAVYIYIYIYIHTHIANRTFVWKRNFLNFKLIK